MDITYISCVLKDGSHQNIIKIHQVSIEPIEIALGIYLNPHSTLRLQNKTNEIPTSSAASRLRRCLAAPRLAPELAEVLPACQHSLC